MADQEEIEKAAAALLKIVQAVAVTLENHGNQINRIIQESTENCFSEAVKAMTSLHNRICALEEVERQRSDMEAIRQMSAGGNGQSN
jgi:predicted RND superfamily exporter protein